MAKHAAKGGRLQSWKTGRPTRELLLQKSSFQRRPPALQASADFQPAASPAAAEAPAVAGAAATPAAAAEALARVQPVMITSDPPTRRMSRPTLTPLEPVTPYVVLFDTMLVGGCSV